VLLRAVGQDARLEGGYLSPAGGVLLRWLLHRVISLAREKWLLRDLLLERKAR